MQQLVLLLLRGVEQTINPMRDAPWLEMSVSSAATGGPSSSPALTTDQLAEYAPSAGGRRVWKSHGPATHMPWRGGAEGLSNGAKVSPAAPMRTSAT